MISGLAQTFEGLLKFFLSKFHLSLISRETNEMVAGNIVVIGAIVGALFLYGVYQQRNGQPITAAPAKNKKIN